jgi:hypothetical protein
LSRRVITKQLAGGYMPFQQISEYRAHAETGNLQSDLTNDAASKLQWSAKSESWLLLADNVVKKDNPGLTSAQ